MNAKRPEPPPIRLEDPPTEIEIAEAIDLAKTAGCELVALTIRRLAFQVDRLNHLISRSPCGRRPTSPPPPKKRY